jgi:cyclic-di-GMP phosphodiesterase TipF (flagellum assembly factor)
MQRIVAIFTFICMVLIAGSIGVVLFLFGRLTPVEAGTISVAVLTALALCSAVPTRVRDRRDVGRQVGDLAQGTADLARQVAEISRRVAGMDGKIEAVAERTRSAASPLMAEIDELGALLKDLAEQVADHEMKLAAYGDAAVPAPAPAAPPAVTAPPTSPPPPRTEARPLAQAPPVAAAPEPPGVPEPEEAGQDAASKAMLELIRGAIEASRIDLYLQPVVTLPQRKVRYYEAMSRLRTADGELVMPVDFLPHAEAGGLMPRIDNLLVFRCVQVVRRLLLKNRDIGLFCNLSTSTLCDGTVFPQLLEFMDANRALAPSLVFEFTQRAMRAMGPIENESLAALASRGFRFSVDHVTDLRMEGRDLAERGFRFVKAPAELLLNRSGGALASDIHPADLSDLLGRFGIDLVAERIESEAAVVDLLDHHVRFGQGFLFSPPRPVRPEALQGIADRGELVAMEAGADTPGAAAPASAAGAAGPAAARAESERAAKGEPGRVSGLARLARPAFTGDGR